MNNAKKFYIFISTVLVVCGMGVMALEIYGFVRLNDTKTSTAEESYRSSRLSEKNNALAHLSAGYQKIKDDEEIIYNTLPDSKDTSKLLSDIDSLATENGLELTMVQSVTTGVKVKTADKSLLQTAKGKYSYELPMTLQVTGSYQNVLGFVKKLENYQRVLNITAVDISKSDSEPNKILLKIKVIAYLMK